MEPDPIPSNGFIAALQCHRLCEASLHIDDITSSSSSSSPLVFSGINPGSYCNISPLLGIYGTDWFEFDSGNVVITDSVGGLTFGI